MKAILQRLAADGDIDARWGRAALLLILLLAGLQSALMALALPFWFDEVCGILVFRLPSMAVVGRALGDAVDSAPPFFYVVERLSRHVVGHDHLGYRLPSILGLLLAIFCVYLALSRRMSRLAALAGASFILCTQLSLGYAADARPYALMIGCIAAAIVAWQRIDDANTYAAALAVALAAAVSLHYYAILIWAIFVAAEVSAWIVKRRIRVYAAAALAAGILPMAFFARLLIHLRQYYGPHYFAPPNLKLALQAHDELFNMDGHWGWILAAGLSVLLFLGAGRKNEELPGERKAGAAKVPVEERILVLLLLWLPLIVFAAAKLDHGGMEEKFMLPAILGAALAIGFAVERAPAAGRALLVLLLLVQYISITAFLERDALKGTLRAARTGMSGEVDAIGQLARQPDLPILFSNGMEYLPAVYYTPAGSQGKIYAIADPAASVAFPRQGADTGDLDVLVMQKYAPLHVADYNSFVTEHPAFLLVTDKELGDKWLPIRLVNDGDTLTLVSAASGNGDAIFRVRVRP